MSTTVLTHQFDNGLVLLAEPMEWLESAAFALLLPGGSCNDPTGLEGISNFTCEMVQRGCGGRSSRQFVDELEKLGVDRGAAVSNAHASYGGAMLANNLFLALEIYADLVRCPHLPEEQLHDGRQVCFQELRAVEDDVAQKVMNVLRQKIYPDPWGRVCHGSEEALERITIGDIRNHFQATYHPRGAILAVAGKIQWEPLVDHVAKLFGDWQPVLGEPLNETVNSSEYQHLDYPSSQTHIGVAFDCVPYSHPDYYQARASVGVLSDGMSSRLFTEVREKRGLCYSVYATMNSLKDRGAVLCYSGTSTTRAQETLDVLMAELVRLRKGVAEDELDRLKARIKSTLIMQQESSRSRTSSIAADWYLLGQVQTLQDISQRVDDLSCESINTYLAAHPPADFVTVTLGSQPLEVPIEVS